MTHTLGSGWSGRLSNLAWALSAAVILAVPASSMAGMELVKEIRGGLTQVASGDTFSYLLRYRAASTTTDFYGAYLVDTLPPEIEYIGSIGTPHTASMVYNPGTREFRVTFIDPLPAGSTGEIEVQVRFPPGSTTNGTHASNFATIGASNSPPVNSGTVTIAATASDRARAAKSLVGGSIPLNQNVSYTVSFVNPSSSGSLNVTNVTMIDTLPDGAEFVSASGGGVYDAGSNLVSWSLSNLSANQTISRTVTVRFPQPPFDVGDSVTNRVTVHGTPIGRPPTNYNAAVTNSIQPPSSSSSFSKSVDGNYVYEGKPILKAYTFALSNTGNTPLDNVVVTDAVPSEVHVTRIDTGNFSGTPSGLGGDVNVYYQTTANATWTAAPGNPYAGASGNSQIAVSGLGLGVGEEITALKWEFGSIPANYQIANLSFRGYVGPVDRDGNPLIAGQIVTNIGHLAYTDFNGTPTNKQDDATLTVKTPRPVVQLTKTMSNSNPVNDGDWINFRLTLQNRTEAAEPLIDPVIADLLSPFLTFSNGSEIVFSAPVGAPAPTFTATDDYNGTGRTLLKWDWSGYSLPTNASIEVRFMAKLTQGTIYGSKTNDMNLVSWGNTNVDTASTSTTIDTNDLDGNGSTTDTNLTRQFVYTIRGVAAMDSVKWVKGELDSGWSKYPTNGFTVPGGLADYKLIVKNVGNVPMRSISVTDILPIVGDTGVIDLSPRDSEWRPNLAGEVIAPPGVTVYYSEESNPTRTDMDPSGPAGSVPANWSTNIPADFTRTRSVKFDFGSIVLQPQQELELTWPMRAPVGAPAGGEVAWNSFGYVATRTDSGQALLPSEPIKVGIEIVPDTNAVYGNFVWFDANRDGQQGVDEVGVNGIKVYLYEDSGAGGLPDGVRDPLTDHLIGYTITGDDYGGQPGYYLFPNLDRGEYYATFDIPQGFVVTTNDLGGDDALDSDGTDAGAATNYWTEITHLDQTEHDITWDLGLWVEPYGVELVKTAGATPDGGIEWVLSGNAVVYSYKVTNTGALDLVNLKVTDDKIGDIGTIARLAAGASQTLMSPPTTILLDVTNIGTVRGRPAVPGGPEIPGLPPATDNDDAIVKVLARIGDRVWYDTNANGIQNGGESGVANVRVFLLNSVGQPVATNTTSGTGNYAFVVPPGDYTVQFDLASLPAGYIVSPRGPQGTSDATDSDANPITGLTELTSLAPAEHDPSWDMGIWWPASIGDLVWYDWNQNGLQDGGTETGVAGVNVYLLNDVGAPIATNVTDASGLYLFDLLIPGTYSVQFDLTTAPTGFLATAQGGAIAGPNNSDGDETTGLTDAVTLNPGDAVRYVDMGIYTKGRLGDTVWYDVNYNGQQDGGETGVSGVTVYLWLNGSVVATNVTDGAGKYIFENLISGDYRVQFDYATLPAQYKPTIQGPAGSSDATDSDADIVTGFTESTHLDWGEEDLTWDLGIVRRRADVSLLKRRLPIQEYPSKWSIPISKGQQFIDGDYWLRLEYGEPSFDVWGPGNLKSGVVLDSDWHHVAGRFIRGTNVWGPHTMQILIDGVVVATKTDTGTTDPSTAPLFLGCYMGNTAYYAGLMDEVRLSRGARSDAWLQTSVAQQRNPFAFVTSGAEGAGTLPGYAYRRPLTVNGALVAGPLTNFPVLVRLTDAFLASKVATADGSDLVFTLADGTVLPHEIEYYRKVSGKLVAWVRIPELAAGVPQTFYVNYGNATPPAPAFAAEDVWDNGFMMVQHLEETAGPVLDSTRNNNDGTVSGALPSAYGRTDGCYAFDGTDDKIEIPDAATIELNSTDFTVEGWFCRKTVGADALFEIVVQNAGPDTADQLVVSDPLNPSFTLIDEFATQGVFTDPPGLWTIGDLPAGGMATLRTAVDFAGCGPLTNAAEVASTPTLDPDSTPGNHVPGEDDISTVILAGLPVPAPAVTLVKRAGAAADGAPLSVLSGSSVTYTYVVQNSGDTYLGNLVVSDDILGAVGTVAGPIAPGATAVLTASVASVTASVTNIGSVTAHPMTAAGLDLPCHPADVSDTDDAVVLVTLPPPPVPGIEVVKVAGAALDGAILTVAQGANVTYTYTIRNTGNVPLTNISVTDDKLGALGPVAALAVGASVWLQETATNVMADVTNVVTVSSIYAGSPVSDTDDAIVHVTIPPPPPPPAPAIQLVKIAGGAPDGAVYTAYEPANVTFAFTIRNTGNVALTNVTLVDPTLGYAFPTTAVVAAGAQVVLTHTLSGMTAGTVTNTATASGSYGATMVTDDDDAIVNIVPVPNQADLSLTKRAVAMGDYVPTWSIPISKGQQFVDGDYWLRLEYGEPSFDVWGPGNLKSGVVIDAAWHHVVGRFTRGAQSWGPHTMEILIDGQVVATKVATGTPDPSNASLFLGAYLGSSHFYAGLMDEVRLSRGARSDAWLKATHDQQANPAAFVSLGAEEPGTLPGFANRRALAVNGALVTGTLSNFPVLVSLSDPFLTSGVAVSNGADLVFTDASGAALAQEIESFSLAAGKLVAWVRLPEVASGAPTTFYLHYGNTTPPAPAFPASAVWDAGFMMVQHLEERSGTVLDSTANGNNGTVSGAMPVYAGSANGAYAFDGINDKIEVPNAASLQLNATDFTVEGWFSRINASGAGTRFEVTVQNAGPKAATNVVVRDVLDAGFTLVQADASQGDYTMPPGLWNVGALPVGGSATLWLLVSTNAPGPLTNVAEVVSCDQSDPDSTPNNGAPGEDDIGTAIVNGGGASLPPAPPHPSAPPAGTADFAVTEIAFSPVNPTAGGTFTAFVTVMNVGSGSGDAGILRLWPDHLAAATAGEAAPSSAAIGTLAAGAWVRLTVPGLIAPSGSGTFNFRAFADADNALTESSEGNNQLTRTYSIGSSVSEKPDFAVTDITFIPGSPAPGATFTAQVTVKNQGLAAGDAGLLRVWLNQFGAAAAGDAGDAQLSVGVLAPGQSLRLNIPGLTAASSNGTYTFRAFVDADGTEIEQSEGNNQKTRTYGISGGLSGGGTPGKRPDFAITEVTFVPSTLTQGGTFTAFVTVKNSGEAVGDAGHLDIWVDHPAAATVGEAGDAWQAVGALAPGESRRLTFAGLTASAANGAHTFRVFADSANGADEQSEGNNQATRSYGFY